MNLPFAKARSVAKDCQRATFYLLLLFCGCGVGLDHYTQTEFIGSPTSPLVDPTDATADPTDGGVDPTHGARRESGDQPAQNGSPNKNRSQPDPFAKYCQVDNQGRIISSDTIKAVGQKRIQGIGGGCVSRPIREIWAVILNPVAMKTKDLAEYDSTPQLTLADPAKQLYFVFDMKSVVRKQAFGFGLFQMEWTSRWYHSVRDGNYQNPTEIVINFQKVAGSAHVAYDKEAYQLKYITPNITRFVMTQVLEALTVNTKRVEENIDEILGKMRRGAPDWTALPAQPPI